MAFTPAEWEKHDAIWTAWPAHDDEDRWPEPYLSRARKEVGDMVCALSNGDHVKVLACGEDAISSARAMIGDCAEVIPAVYGDIWMRDTGPIFTYDDAGNLTALRFKTNGWGGKYLYAGDDKIGDFILAQEGITATYHDFVLEGGSVEPDGQGQILTTRECILNDNRNPGWDQTKAEAMLKAAFSATRIIWLDDGMLNDHTDGHIDNIARFIAPNHAVCQRPSGSDDPNGAVFANIYKTLKEAGVEVTQIPSPGLVHDDEGEIIPASHMNFIIGNGCVVVPTYDTPYEDEAIAILQALFPNKTVIGSSSKAIITGGGSFHCITQQVPARKI